jgi:hypothetical protein
VSSVTKHLPGLARRKVLPSIPGTGAVDLAPIAQPLPVLEPKAILTGKEPYAAIAVKDRLESRAYRVQQPMVNQAKHILGEIAKERRMRVKNDLGEAVRVSLSGLEFEVDPGITEQPRSVALAFEERKNALLRHKQILGLGVEGGRRGRPEVEALAATLEYTANQDISI